MTQKDVSYKNTNYFNSQRVDQDDFQLDQTAGTQYLSSVINNHSGSGVLPNQLTPRILWDSSVLSTTANSLLAAGNFDGTGISPTLQPSDTNYGNQLQLSLSGSNVFGRRSVKVVVIGLAFDGTLQYERFNFYRNEVQVSEKHFAKIISLIFNDFLGNNYCSRNQGGNLVISEANGLQLSRSSIMIQQNIEPDIFWRDFKVAGTGISLQLMLQTAIGPLYSVDALNINTTGRPNRTLVANDVTTQIGEKFLAKTNNLQKVSLLLGVAKNGAAAEANWYDWTGDLIVSIYPLQNSVSCPTDIVPELAIEFDPSNQPLAQLSYNQASLKTLGYVLTDVLQPVDFVFSNSQIGSASSGKIVPGDYYAVTVKRSGAASSGSVQLGVGNNQQPDARETIFSGSWVDVVEEDLWFRVWTDAAKLTDGKAYDGGVGCQIDKITTDATTGSTKDQIYKDLSFVDTGESTVNFAVLQAIEEGLDTIQEEITGNPVFSHHQYIPAFSFLSQASLTLLQSTSNPLIIGAIEDINPKNNPSLTKTQSKFGLANANTFTIINPDADLLSLNLIGSLLLPDSIGATSLAYMIFKSTVCQDGYGDVNGDGYIDATDIARATQLIGESLASTSTQNKIKSGLISTLELLRADVDGDGYITSTDVNLITSYVNKVTNSFPVGSTFSHLTLTVDNQVGRWDGYYDCLDGYVRIVDGYAGQRIPLSSLDANQILFDGYETGVQLQTIKSYSTTPFSSVVYAINPLPFWQPWLIKATPHVRLTTAAFINSSAIQHPNCNPSVTICQDQSDRAPSVDPGRVDYFVGGNIILGEGEILRPDQTPYPVDVEIGTIILNLPTSQIDKKSINLFDKLIVDAGGGLSRSGDRAFKYSDCSTVQPQDLQYNRLRFSVSIQSYVPAKDGYDSDGYFILENDKIGCYIDPASGILTISTADLQSDPIYQSLVSRIQVEVYLKKSGWKNQIKSLLPSQVVGLLSS